MEIKAVRYEITMASGTTVEVSVNPLAFFVTPYGDLVEVTCYEDVYGNYFDCLATSVRKL